MSRTAALRASMAACVMLGLVSPSAVNAGMPAAWVHLGPNDGALASTLLTWSRSAGKPMELSWARDAWSVEHVRIAGVRPAANSVGEWSIVAIAPGAAPLVTALSVTRSQERSLVELLVEMRDVEPSPEPDAFTIGGLSLLCYTSDDADAGECDVNVSARSQGSAPTAGGWTPKTIVAQDTEVVVSARFGARRLTLLADDGGEPFAFEVRRPGEQALLQRLEFEAQEPFPGSERPALLATDLNGDAHADLMLLSWQGATGNVGYLAWRFDPAQDAFVAIEGFDNLSQPEVEAGGACIRSHNRGGAAGAIYVAERWCWRDAALRLEWAEQQSFESTGETLTCVRRALHDGEMVEIERADMTCEELDAAKAAPAGR